MISKVCSSSLYNIGHLGCKAANPFVDAVSIFLATSDQEFASMADFGTLAKWQEAIAAGKIVPIHDIVEIDDQSEDPQYYEAPNGVRIPRRLGHYRHSYMFNKSFEVHKALQSYRGADMNIYTLDDAGNLCGYSPDGTKVKGMSLSMLNPEKMRAAGQDNTPAWTPLTIDQADAKQWNEKGLFLKPGWDPKTLEAITDVELRIVSASATSIIIGVDYYNGLQPDGTSDLVPVAGIDPTDFVFTTTTPTGDPVDNGDGTYTASGTDMVSGSVDLKAPASAASTGQPIKSTGPATITI